MNKLISLTKRNCLVYLKDGSAVFFSLLSMIITLVLMFGFLGDMNVNYITELQITYGGERNAAQDLKYAESMVQYWTLAGIMVVNALTVTLTVVGKMVTDRESIMLKSFYTAPVSKFVIGVSYMAAAIVIGFLLCSLTFAAYLIYIRLNGGELLGFVAILKVLGCTLLNVTIFAMLMYLIALFVKSSSAWGGIATIVGTLVGFLGALYVPLGNLPTGAASVLKCLPVLHATSLMRKTMCEAALKKAFTGVHEGVLPVFREVMGIDIVVKEKLLSDEVQLLFLGFCGMITLGLIAIAGKKQRG